MIPIILYEELPDGLKVMIREEDGVDVIVIDSRLSRVERARARDAGKAMLAQRRREALLPIGGLVEGWGDRLREWAPVYKGPATAVAGGALAMAMVTGSDVLVDDRHLPPRFIAQGPAITAEPVAAPQTFITTERRPGPRPSPRSLTPTRLGSRPIGKRPNNPAGHATKGRASTPKPTASVRPASEPVEARDTPGVAETVRVHVRDIVKTSVTPKLPVRSEVSVPAIKPPKTTLPDTPKVDVPKPVRLPDVEVDLPKRLPTVRPSTLLKKPVAVGGECGGLVGVKVDPLPKVCVGG